MRCNAETDPEAEDGVSERGDAYMCMMRLYLHSFILLFLFPLSLFISHRLILLSLDLHHKNGACPCCEREMDVLTAAKYESNSAY